MCLPLHPQRPDYVHIEPQRFDFGREPRTGKHARGMAPRVIEGQVEARPPSDSPGYRRSAEEREQATARSISEGSSIADQVTQDRLVAEFIEGLSGEDRELARRSGLVGKGKLVHLADTEHHRGAPARDSDHDPISDLPSPISDAGSHNGRALFHGENTVVDFLEPRASVAIKDLSEIEVAEAHDAFSRAIAWVHEATLLMKKARRMAVLIAYCRPDLSATLPSDHGLRSSLTQILEDQRRLVSLVFGRVFAWAREVPDIAGLGIRADIIAYVIRPSLLDAATNAQIGAPLNNTRAAVNKLVQEFRDTFAGIRAPAMRPESTRQACREAQLQ